MGTYRIKSAKKPKRAAKEKETEDLMETEPAKEPANESNQELSEEVQTKAAEMADKMVAKLKAKMEMEFEKRLEEQQNKLKELKERHLKDGKRRSRKDKTQRKKDQESSSSEGSSEEDRLERKEDKKKRKAEEKLASKQEEEEDDGKDQKLDLEDTDPLMKRLFERMHREIAYKKELSKLKDINPVLLQDTELIKGWREDEDEELEDLHVFNVKMPGRRGTLLAELEKFGEVDHDNTIEHPLYKTVALRVCMKKIDLKLEELNTYIQENDLFFVAPPMKQVLGPDGQVRDIPGQVRTKYDLFVGSLAKGVIEQDIVDAFPQGLLTKVAIKRDKNCAVLSCASEDKMKEALLIKSVMLKGTRHSVIESFYNCPATKNITRIWSGYWPDNATVPLVRRFLEKRCNLNPIAIMKVTHKDTEMFRGYFFLDFDDQAQVARALKMVLNLDRKVVKFDNYKPRNNKGNNPYPARNADDNHDE